jgi:predicted DNA-binding transcriptional regulator YafY
MTLLSLTRRRALLLAGGGLAGFPAAVHAGPVGLGALVSAVRQRRSVRLHYGEDATGSRRTLVPLRLSEGWNGRLYVEAWQVSGPSQSGVAGQIKTFRLDRMRGIRVAGSGIQSASLLRDEPPGYIRQVFALREDANPRARLWLGHDRAERYHPAGTQNPKVRHRTFEPKAGSAR